MLKKRILALAGTAALTAGLVPLAGAQDAPAVIVEAPPAAVVVEPAPATTIAVPAGSTVTVAPVQPEMVASATLPPRDASMGPIRGESEVNYNPYVAARQPGSVPSPYRDMPGSGHTGDEHYYKQFGGTSPQ